MLLSLLFALIFFRGCCFVVQAQMLELKTQLYEAQSREKATRKKVWLCAAASARGNPEPAFRLLLLTFVFVSMPLASSAQYKAFVKAEQQRAQGGSGPSSKPSAAKRFFSGLTIALLRHSVVVWSCCSSCRPLFLCLVLLLLLSHALCL